MLRSFTLTPQSTVAAIKETPEDQAIQAQVDDLRAKGKEMVEVCETNFSKNSPPSFLSLPLHFSPSSLIFRHSSSFRCASEGQTRRATLGVSVRPTILPGSSQAPSANPVAENPGASLSNIPHHFLLPSYSSPGPGVCPCPCGSLGPGTRARLCPRACGGTCPCPCPSPGSSRPRVRGGTCPSRCHSSSP